MAQSIITVSTIALLLCSQVYGSDVQNLRRQVRDLKTLSESSTRLLTQLLAGSADTTDLDKAIQNAKDTLGTKGLSAACLANATKKLDDLNMKTAQEWANCTMTTAVEKLGLIVYETADFASGLLVILDEYINGFFDCLSYNPLKLIPCFISYGFTSIKNIWATIRLIKTYIGEVEDNISKVNTIITKACLALPTNDIQKIIDDFSKCT